MSNLNYPLQQIKTWDMELCAFCNRQSRNFTVRNLFRLASRLGDGVFWYVLMIVLLLEYQGAALTAVVHMIAVGVTGTILYKFIKGKTLRPRPFNVYPAIVCVGKTLDQFSFPSGHTMHAVAFSIVSIAYFPALFWLVVPFSVLVGLSRPILGLHYPSDVLAGAALGAAVAGLSFNFF
ncbi:phosphatase PAP2 family protein [Sideroxydans lithotrophicus]|uniref:Phosphoesterase PA-phosphatase related protein n=1 Tax=Sideroxydans lithotrophicus (strain ES-1) TaxID=580332 RepID=D5CMM1_SIDLE|nr:phosphatase PAP2 family protein [Sideroxydans lithotrophicus]ADE12693.1 phosphoesterase PA-phosphatase related protein [Sideroxydans lithotrophicus ES-1]